MVTAFSDTRGVPAYGLWGFDCSIEQSKICPICGDMGSKVVCEI